MSQPQKILILSGDDVLVLHRSEFKERPEVSHAPDLPGGMVDPNESERNAVVREVKEETGIILDPNAVTLCFAKTIAYDDSHISQSKLLYITKLSDKPTIQLSYEHESYEWTDIQSLLSSYKFVPFYEEAITYVTKFNVWK